MYDCVLKGTGVKLKLDKEQSVALNESSLQCPLCPRSLFSNPLFEPHPLQATIFRVTVKSNSAPLTRTFNTSLRSCVAGCGNRV